MPSNPARTFLYTFTIWLFGFVWGSIVFMIPTLKEIPSVPYVSSCPAISVPGIIGFWFLAKVFSKKLLAGVPDPSSEGIRIGVIFAGTCLVLDFFVIALAFNAGLELLVTLSIWLAYGAVLYVPYREGKKLTANKSLTE